MTTEPFDGDGNSWQPPTTRFANVSGSLIPHQWQYMWEELIAARRRIKELEAQVERMKAETWDAAE